MEYSPRTPHDMTWTGFLRRARVRPVRLPRGDLPSVAACCAIALYARVAIGVPPHPGDVLVALRIRRAYEHTGHLVLNVLLSRAAYCLVVLLFYGAITHLLLRATRPLSSRSLPRAVLRIGRGEG